MDLLKQSCEKPEIHALLEVAFLCANVLKGVDGEEAERWADLESRFRFRATELLLQDPRLAEIWSSHDLQIYLLRSFDHQMFPDAPLEERLLVRMQKLFVGQKTIIDHYVDGKPSLVPHGGARELKRLEPAIEWLIGHRVENRGRRQGSGRINSAQDYRDWVFPVIQERSKAGRGNTREEVARALMPRNRKGRKTSPPEVASVERRLTEGASKYLGKTWPEIVEEALQAT
jgi:hypothetical protein